MSGKVLAIAWKEKPRAAMVATERAEISTTKGIVGDFRGGVEDRQITIVFEEDWRAACAALGRDLPWTARRANLFIAGLANPRQAGGVLRIGPVRLLVTGETEPCSVMDRQAPGLRQALTPDWRAGLTTRVLEGGEVQVGDVVAIED